MYHICGQGEQHRYGMLDNGIGVGTRSIGYLNTQFCGTLKVDIIQSNAMFAQNLEFGTGFQNGRGIFYIYRAAL
jgi:hypothetical protein